MPAFVIDDSICLPPGLGIQNATSLFEICRTIREFEGDIQLDASRLDYIDPMGMATLRALFEEISQDKPISMNYLSGNLISYLARMDFFKDLDIGGVDFSRYTSRRDQSKSLVEITKVTEHYQAEEIASRLANAITGKLTLSDPDAPANEFTGRNEFDSYRGPIEYSLKELLENSLTHARLDGRITASVWVCCQYYAKFGAVRMAIVDNGCGFLTTLARHPEVREPTDRNAIAAALLPRVSCNRGAMARFSGRENQGVGLTTTAKIASRAGGGLIVASGNAIHCTQRNRFFELESHAWQGVSIGFTCLRDELPSIRIPDLLPDDEPRVGDGRQEIDIDLDFR